MTSTTRRSLIRAGALAVALAPLLAVPEVYAAVTTRRDLYSRTRFSPLRHKTFRLEASGRHWRVKLTKVSNLANCKKQDPHAFSLTFRAGSAGPEQGSYLLQRSGFKATTLFLVPSDRERRTYQAVIFRKP